MSSMAAAIPRLRFRRPTPPSGWRVFYASLLGYAFSAVAHIAWGVAKGSAPWLLVADGVVLLFWAAVISMWREHYRFFKELERREIPLPPVPKRCWLFVGLAWAMNLSFWIIG